MAADAHKCLNCGKQLSKQQVWQGCKYCSRKCFADGYWGEQIQFGHIKTRSKKFLQAIELCQSGMTQAEAARLIGVHPQTVSGWFTKSGIAWDERRCAHCGKPLVGARSRSKKKYCNKKCARKAQYIKKHPSGHQRRFDPELRAKALEMYWGGLGGRVIAEHLDLPAGTLHSWIHDFGHLRKRRRDPEMMKLLPVNLRLESAKSAAEWKKILRENAFEGSASSVVIVCGAFHGRTEIGGLAAVVFDTLKCNPCDGRVYAFCSLRGEQISTIRFANGTFLFTKTPKKSGGYIWPKDTVGNKIEVRQNEFEYLLGLRKKRGAKPYFT